jgi:glucose-1-phosphate thymidylyltransferase
MLAGVQEILIITTPQDADAFKSLLGDGSKFGVQLKYAAQLRPEGIAQALIIGEKFLENCSCLMILGDNIFHGVGLGSQLSKLNDIPGSHVFTFEVNDPRQYGVLTVNQDGRITAITEKPRNPDSNLAITGLYYFDKSASKFALQVKPSGRGELEITEVLSHYLKLDQLTHTHLSRGTTWLDTGNPNALNDASNYVRLIEERSGLKIGCPEEIALQNGWLSPIELKHKLSKSGSSNYYHYLHKILVERKY